MVEEVGNKEKIGQDRRQKVENVEVPISRENQRESENMELIIKGEKCGFELSGTASEEDLLGPTAVVPSGSVHNHQQHKSAPEYKENDQKASNINNEHQETPSTSAHFAQNPKMAPESEEEKKNEESAILPEHHHIKKIFMKETLS